MLFKCHIFSFVICPLLTGNTENHLTLKFKIKMGEHTVSIEILSNGLVDHSRGRVHRWEKDPVIAFSDISLHLFTPVFTFIRLFFSDNPFGNPEKGFCNWRRRSVCGVWPHSPPPGFPYGPHVDIEPLVERSVRGKREQGVPRTTEATSLLKTQAMLRIRPNVNRHPPRPAPTGPHSPRSSSRSWFKYSGMVDKILNSQIRNPRIRFNQPAIFKGHK